MLRAMRQQGRELIRRAVLCHAAAARSRGTPRIPGQKPSRAACRTPETHPLGHRRPSAPERPGVGEGDDAAQGMERVAGHLLLAAAGDHIFAVQGQIDVLTGHEQGIQTVVSWRFLHGPVQIIGYGSPAGSAAAGTAPSENRRRRIWPAWPWGVAPLVQLVHLSSAYLRTVSRSSGEKRTGVRRRASP